MMPKVSIVIPVYNVEKYLAECLDSIICQTLNDIEIICVNDGSTDSSADILDGYAGKDARIKVVHKENAGYGSAVNIGVRIAQGEYIGIVDSDDYILPEMYETLYTAAKRDDVDFVKSDPVLVYDEYVHTIHDEPLDNYYNRVLDEKSRKIFYCFTMNTWTGIYKREFLVDNGIWHNETPGASYQDNGFWMLTMSICRKAEWLDKAFYMHRQDNPGASTRSKGKMLAMINEYDYVGRILQNKNLDDEYRICNFFRMSRHIATFYRIDNSLKSEYAGIVMEDYAKYKSCIDWTSIPHSGNVLDWIENLFREKNEFCKRIIDAGQDANEKLEKAENLVIYGTGNRATWMYLKLKKKGCFSKVLFAAVTDVGCGEKNFYGLEVKNAKDIVPLKEKVLVLLCVSKKTKAYGEIEAYLKELNITNYCDTEWMNVC